MNIWTVIVILLHPSVLHNYMILLPIKIKLTCMVITKKVLQWAS